jgi:hypothetical protein
MNTAEEVWMKGIWGYVQFWSVLLFAAAVMCFMLAGIGEVIARR